MPASGREQTEQLAHGRVRARDDAQNRRVPAFRPLVRLQWRQRRDRGVDIPSRGVGSLEEGQLRSESSTAAAHSTRAAAPGPPARSRRHRSPGPASRRCRRDHDPSPLPASGCRHGRRAPTGGPTRPRRCPRRAGRPARGPGSEAPAWNSTGLPCGGRGTLSGPATPNQRPRCPTARSRDSSTYAPAGSATIASTGHDCHSCSTTVMSSAARAYRSSWPDSRSIP